MNSDLTFITNEKKEKLPGKYYELLDKNKEAFIFATTEEIIKPEHRVGRDSASNILRILKVTLKNTKQFTDEQENNHGNNKNCFIQRKTDKKNPS